MTGCVIDREGYFKTFVALTDDGKPVAYRLAEGERVVEASPPATRAYAGASGLVQPRWDDEAWGEGASDDEIAAWEAEHPAPEERLAELHRSLEATDYIDNKIVEAMMSGGMEAAQAVAEEYAEQLANRQAWRKEINELEAQGE